jgi:ariadne-1
MESDDFLLYNNSEEEEEEDEADEEEEDEDSGNVSSTGEDEDGLTLALLENEPTGSGSIACPSDRMDMEDFPYEILTTEQIVQHMIDCIKEVNTIVQLPLTITRILLNHFKWDKEKLYEM